MIRSNGEGKPVVSLDIDGTLGDYHRHFLDFASRWFGRPMPNALDINPGLQLYRFMGVSKAKYREAKLAYRQGGWKRWMPAYPGASELTKQIRRMGAEVWICTTRPYLRLDNIDPDTREWLRRNGIHYNAVIFGDDKYNELRRQAGDRVCAVVDDLPEMTRKAFSLGFSPVYIKSQPYNVQAEANAWRFNHLSELQTMILADIKIWKEKQK